MPDRFAFDERIFGFHAQQACEKALKAWPLHLGQNPPRTHDLHALILLLDGAGVELAEQETVGALTLYAVEMRYGDEPLDDLLDRPATVEVCARLVAHVAALGRGA